MEYKVLLDKIADLYGEASRGIAEDIATEVLSSIDQYVLVTVADGVCSMELFLSNEEAEVEVSKYAWSLDEFKDLAQFRLEYGDDPEFFDIGDYKDILAECNVDVHIERVTVTQPNADTTRSMKRIGELYEGLAGDSILGFSIGLQAKAEEDGCRVYGLFNSRLIHADPGAGEMYPADQYHDFDKG